MRGSPGEYVTKGASTASDVARIGGQKRTLKHPLDLALVILTGANSDVVEAETHLPGFSERVTGGQIKTHQWIMKTIQNAGSGILV